MAKPTVAQLAEKIESLQQTAGNVFISAYTVWHAEQIKNIIEKLDKRNEIIKVEISHGFEPGKKSYHVQVWHYKLSNN